MNDKRPCPSLELPDLLRRYPLFQGLDEGALARLSARIARKTLARHKRLFSKGDAANAVIGIVEGEVKITVTGPDGREVIFNVLRAGEMFGEIAVLDGRPRSADAMTMSRCELFYLDRRDFLASLREEPDLSLRMIELCCERIRRISEQVEDVMFLAGPARIAKALLRLSANEADADDACVRVPVTQLEISQIVGLSREVTNKQLREWEKAGFVELERGFVVLRDPAQLGRIANALLALSDR